MSEVLCDKNFPIKTNKILFSKFKNVKKNIINLDNWLKLMKKLTEIGQNTFIKTVFYSLNRKDILDLNQISNGINSKVFNLKFKKKKNLILKTYPFGRDY